MRVAAGQLADADADLDRPDNAGHRGRDSEGCGQAVGKLLRGAAGDEDELVAAQSGDEVARLGGVPQSEPDLGQVAVADGVPAGSVVDRVESVDVGQRDGEGDVWAGGGDGVFGDAAYRQAGHRIGECHRQALLKPVDQGAEVVDLGAHPGGTPEAENDREGEHPAGGLDEQGCRRGDVGKHGDGQQWQPEDQAGGHQAEQDGDESGSVRPETTHDDLPPRGRDRGGHADRPAGTRTTGRSQGVQEG
nr:hypothetical protein [Jidongwangia harbinensis]